MECTQDKRTQLEKANQQLLEIAPFITRDDRKEVLIHYSNFTLIQYTKGRGKNLDTAIKLLKLFRARIEKREEFINGDVKILSKN